jgi:hypothetical protein
MTLVHSMLRCVIGIDMVECCFRSSASLAGRPERETRRAVMNVLSVNVGLPREVI